MPLLSHWRKNSANRRGNSFQGAGINSTMFLVQRRLTAMLWGILSLCVVLLIVAGCEISPRRFVINGPGPSVTPTPSPGITPTPTPIPTATPIPTPTPVTMNTPVPRQDAPAQFLFAVSPDSPMMHGFRINNDGSLSPVAGSPFVTGKPMHSAVSIHRMLIVASQDAIFAFAVDKETGAIQQTDVVKTGAIAQLIPGRSSDVVVAATQSGNIAFGLSNGKLNVLPESMTASEITTTKNQVVPSAALDESGRFMYVADPTKAELAAFRVENGKPEALSPPAYPVPHGTAAVAVVKADQ